MLPTKTIIWFVKAETKYTKNAALIYLSLVLSTPSCAARAPQDEHESVFATDETRSRPFVEIVVGNSLCEDSPSGSYIDGCVAKEWVTIGDIRNYCKDYVIQVVQQVLERNNYKLVAKEWEELLYGGDIDRMAASSAAELLVTPFRKVRLRGYDHYQTKGFWPLNKTYEIENIADIDKIPSTEPGVWSYLNFFEIPSTRQETLWRFEIVTERVSRNGRCNPQMIRKDQYQNIYLELYNQEVIRPMLSNNLLRACIIKDLFN